MVSASRTDSSGQVLCMDDLVGWQPYNTHTFLQDLGAGHGITINRAPHLPSLCLALQEYLNNQPRGHPTLFIREDGSPLTQFQCTIIFHRAVQSISTPAEWIAAHSFHRGCIRSSGFITYRHLCHREMEVRGIRDYIRPFPTASSSQGRERPARHRRWARPEYNLFFPTM